MRLLSVYPVTVKQRTVTVLDSSEQAYPEAEVDPTIGALDQATGVLLGTHAVVTALLSDPAPPARVVVIRTTLDVTQGTAAGRALQTLKHSQQAAMLKRGIGRAVTLADTQAALQGRTTEIEGFTLGRAEFGVFAFNGTTKLTAPYDFRNSANPLAGFLNTAFTLKNASGAEVAYPNFHTGDPQPSTSGPALRLSQ